MPGVVNYSISIKSDLVKQENPRTAIKQLALPIRKTVNTNPTGTTLIPHSKLLSNKNSQKNSKKGYQRTILSLN